MATTINAQAPYSATGQAATTGAKAPGALDRDAFMKLLVAQLAHQDPMSPSDPSQFVSQLSQFTSLEQLVNMKDGMDLLAVTQTAGTSAQMVSFIGKEISFDGSGLVWKDGAEPVTTSYSIDRNAAEVSVKVLDDQGRTVYETDPVPMNAGKETFEFDGKKPDGTKLPDGTYHVVVSAKDAEGKTVQVKTETHGTVTGVTFAGGYPQLMLADGRVIGLAQVIEVLAADGTSASDSNATTQSSTAGSSDTESHLNPTTETVP